MLFSYPGKNVRTFQVKRAHISNQACARLILNGRTLKMQPYTPPEDHRNSYQKYKKYYKIPGNFGTES